MNAVMVRRSWADVTLGEYAALAIIERGAAADEALCRYWDDVHARNPFRGDEPTRLTPAGVAWLEDIRARCATADDESVLIESARAVLKELGALTTMGAARIMGGF